MTECSTELVFGVLQPGDPDYPLSCIEGAGASIGAIRARCNKGAPWEDPDFPPNDVSIGQAKGDDARGEAGKSAGKYVWLRAPEMCRRAKRLPVHFSITDEGKCGVEASGRCSNLDIHQGVLGDCWYLSTLATLSETPEQFNIVVPPDNDNGFDDDAYCGAFHFRFFNMAAGKYVDVVVDDYIPCAVSDMGWNDPAFASVWVDQPGVQSNEFWVALVEKAFAKFRGSYHAIEGGGTATAMEIFTGGFSRWYTLADWRDPAQYDEFHAKIKRYLDDKQFFGLCSQGSLENAEKAGCADGYTKLNLKTLHAYSVLGGEEVREKDTGRTLLILKVKNPWGQGEWKGRFSDGDDEGWATLERDLRRKNAQGSTNIDEGVFWMDFHDVIKYFNSLDYCLFGLDEGTKFCTMRSEWPAALQEQKTSLWDKQHLQLFPVFKFDVAEGPMQKPAGKEGKCILVLRVAAGKAGVHMDPCPQFKYWIYAWNEGEDLSETYKNNRALADGRNQWDFVNGMDIYLDPGKYVIVVGLDTRTEGMIPKGFVGKALPFAVSLYTENDTCLERIN